MLSEGEKGKLRTRVSRLGGAPSTGPSRHGEGVPRALPVGTWAAEATVEKHAGVPHHPAIPLLGIYLKKTMSLTQKDECTPTSTAASPTTSEIRSNPDGDRRRTRDTSEIHVAQNPTARNEIVCIDLEGIMLSEINQINTVFYVESKQTNQQNWAPGNRAHCCGQRCSWGRGTEMAEGGKKVQTSS